MPWWLHVRLGEATTARSSAAVGDVLAPSFRERVHQYAGAENPAPDAPGANPNVNDASTV